MAPTAFAFLKELHRDSCAAAARGGGGGGGGGGCGGSCDSGVGVLSTAEGLRTLKKNTTKKNRTML